jgi:minor extracellular serine protease Vpr
MVSLVEINQGGIVLKSRRDRSTVGLLAALLLLLLAAVPAQGLYRPADGTTVAAGSDYAFVQFGDAPLASYDGSISGYTATRPQRGQKLDLNSPAAKKYGNRLKAQRENYEKWLSKQMPQVQVVTEYSVVFNGLGLKLNGATLKQIQGGPGTMAAGMSATYAPAMSASHGVINDGPVWTALGGQDNAGAGIKVGVIDTGIDASHPFLDDTGFTAPEGFPKGDTRFTSNKVIVAKVFVEHPWLSAEAVQSHGTHVSGTIAGRAGTHAPMASGLSGVAPGAWLGSYNVFPGNVDNAKSLFIAKAVEEAVVDGMDVLNLSLGGTAHQGKDILEMAVDAAADAGVVVAIAAGNEGPGYYTVGSPGTAGNVITVAAITNAHEFSGSVESAVGAVKATTGSGNGELKNVMTGTYDVWANYAGGDTLACTPVSGNPLAGKIALVQRGVCTFSDKINNAAAAGAVAVIMYQRTDLPNDDPIAMSTDGVIIPAVMVRLADGEALAAYTGDHTVTLNPAQEMASESGKLADFTSWGPTPNYTLKPDVAAVGVNVYSSVVGGGYEVYNGTSMATPHVVGSAALLLAYSRVHNLGWGPAEVKAALMGTAHPGTNSDDPLKVGAGIIDLGRAMNPPALAMPSSLSFELVRPVGNHTYAMTFNLTNSTGTAQTYMLSEAGGNLALSPGSVTLAAGESAAITATVVNRGAHEEPMQAGTPQKIRGIVTVDSGSESIRIPYLYVIDYNR